MYSALPSSHIFNADLKLEKSADKIDGAMIMEFFDIS
jgi:hypothetical protein